MSKVQDCSVEIREFELQSRYYAQFRTNILGKGIEHLIPQQSVK